MMSIWCVRNTVTIPDDLGEEINRVAQVMGESKATVLRLAIRAGLPSLTQQMPRPEGYFTKVYQNLDEERLRLQEASTNEDVGSEERDRE